MQSTRPVANPFGLMLNPQAVLQAVESSERLRRLQSRICRPLDKSVLPGADGAMSAADDAAADADGDIGDALDASAENIEADGDLQA